MSNTLLLKSPSSPAISKPRAYRDALGRFGQQFLFDFTDPRCHPNGSIVTGPPAAGYTLTDLLAGVSATFVGTGMTINADGSITFDGSGATSYLSIDTPAHFDMSFAEYEYIAGLHFKVPASGYTTTANWSPMNLVLGNANSAQMWFDMGATALRPRATVGTGSAQITASSGNDVVPGSVYALHQHFDPGTLNELMVNGVSVSKVTASVPTDLVSSGSSPVKIQNAGKMTVYRALLLNYDAALAQETAWMNAGFLEQADILDPVGYAARDRAFATGTLAGAPKTAFA